MTENSGRFHERTKTQTHVSLRRQIRNTKNMPLEHQQTSENICTNKIKGEREVWRASPSLSLSLCVSRSLSHNTSASATSTLHPRVNCVCAC